MTERWTDNPRLVAAYDRQQALADCHRALDAGGHLTFESRNPAAREWETWTEATTRQRYDFGDGEFDIVEVVGKWDGSPFVAGSPEIIVLARRSG